MSRLENRSGAPSADAPDGGTPATEPGAEAPDADRRPTLRVDEARRRSLRPWAIAGGCVMVLAITGAGLTSTPVFHARTIVVDGERHFTERQVLRLAGVGADTNVFRLDEGAVRRRLEREPWIVDAAVSTRLPSSVDISIVEAIPVAVAITQDGRELVAADGTPLGHAAPGSALPEVRLVGDPGQPGPAYDAVVAGAGIAGSLPPAVRGRVDAVVIGADGVITLHLTDGVTVTYGGPDETEAKAEAIVAILDYAASEGSDLVSIDVTAPAAPTARLVGASATVPVLTDETPDTASPSPSPSAQASTSPTP